MSIVWGQSYEQHALTLIFLFNNLFWSVGTLSLLPKKSKSLFWCCCRMTQMLDPQLSILLHFHEGTHRTAKTQNKFRIIHYAPHQSDKPTPFWPKLDSLKYPFWVKINNLNKKKKEKRSFCAKFPITYFKKIFNSFYTINSK